MVNIDMWYGDNIKDCDNVDIFFNGLDGCYWGWIYKDNKIIGDYNTRSSLEVEETFKHLGIIWL